MDDVVARLEQLERSIIMLVGSENPEVLAPPLADLTARTADWTCIWSK